MATFHNATQPGLAIWNAHRQRFIEFRGGYLTTTDPDDIAFICATDHFKRGLITELPEGPLAHRPSPTPPPNSALWKVDVPKRLPAVPRQEQSPPSEPPPRSWPNAPTSRLQSRPDPDALADRHYHLAPFRPGPKQRTPPPPEPTVPLTSPFHPARAIHLPPRLRFACAFLSHLLASGDVPSPTVHARARAAGVRKQALARARDYLHIRIRKTGLHGGWAWSLPEPSPEP